MKQKKIAVMICYLASLLLTQLLAAAEPAASVRSIMQEQLAPNATAIWDAVSYVATVQGVEERAPQSEEDWMALRSAAVALMEASRQLKQPGLRVGVIFDASNYPDFQYRPDEIEALMQSQNSAWLQYLETLESYTLQTMSTIQRRDLEAFTEVNARINEACQDCHSSFWYRPQ